MPKTAAVFILLRKILCIQYNYIGIFRKYFQFFFRFIVQLTVRGIDHTPAPAGNPVNCHASRVRCLHILHRRSVLRECESSAQMPITDIRPEHVLTPYVLILTYFFLTVAELFISPLGLSFVSKIAPKHLQGICQGLWLTSTAIGNLFIALGVTMLNQFPQQWMCWAVFAGFCLVSMSIMLGISEISDMAKS